MNRKAFQNRLWAASIAVLTAGPSFALADEARQVFDTLFAAKMKAAAGTPDRADDVALAKEMLALAKKSVDQPALLSLLCDAAHDLGAKSTEGYASAVEAQQLLADTIEEKRAGAREKLIALLTKQSAAGKPEERESAGERLIELVTVLGDEKTEKKQYAEAAAEYRRALALATQKKSAAVDEVKAKLEWAAARDRAMKQLARLQEKLLKDADSATAEEIVKLHVLELDDPAAAAPYLNRVKNDPLKTLVPLAAAPAETLTEAQQLSLGEWYRSQVAGAQGQSRRTALARAEKYLSGYLAGQTSSSLQRTKVEALLKEIQAESAKLQTPSAKPAKVADKVPPGTDGWSVMCWQGNWNVFPLSKVEAKATKEGLAVKNTSGLHELALLIYGPPLEGDFDFEVEVRGSAAVQIVAASGADQTIYVPLDRPQDWRTVRITRKKDQLDWQVDGKAATPTFARTTDKTMKAYAVVQIRANAVVEVRKVRLVKGK